MSISKYLIRWGRDSMKIPKHKFVVISGLLIVLSLSTLSASAAEKLTPIGSPNNVWIVGSNVNGYSCWSLSSNQVPSLQIRVRGKWVTKSKAKLTKNSKLCESKFPWLATYSWIVDELGTPSKKNRAYDLFARQRIPKTKNFKGYVSPPFLKQVYRNREEHMNDLLDAFLGAPGDGSGTTPPSDSYSKFAGCRYNGKNLWGRVQVVDFAPDVRVQVVSFAPDLRVQEVDFGASSCGRWQYVDFASDLRVQFVQFAPDIRIQMVSFAPGLP